MVVLNTVHSAQQVYAELKARVNDYELYFLSASVAPIQREKRISEIKKKLKNPQKKVGLVATQVVEAGVDLDFDVVIRDFAPLDSIVQAAGRCNRNSKNVSGGRVFVVKLIDPNQNERQLATYVYDGVLITATKRFIDLLDYVPEKEFLGLVERYFKELRKEVKAQERSIIDAIQALNYDAISRFSLIDHSLYQVPVFVELDNNAKELTEKLRKLETLPTRTHDEKMNRRNLLKTIEPELWKYVVSVPAKVALEAGLAQLPFVSSFLWLPKEHPRFSGIYREDIGFAREITHESWFL